MARHRQTADTRLGTLPRRLVLTAIGTAVLVVLAGAVAGTALTATPEAHQASTPASTSPPVSPVPSPSAAGAPTLLSQSGAPTDAEPVPTPPPPTRRPASPSASPSSTALLPCDNYQDSACMQTWWQQQFPLPSTTG